MATTFGKKVQSDNKHLEDLANGQFVHVDGSVTTEVVVSSTACNLGRVNLNTNGSTLALKTGTRVIAIIASDAPEGVFPYGVYCENGLSYVAGGALDATISFN